MENNNILVFERRKKRRKSLEEFAQENPLPFEGGRHNTLTLETLLNSELSHLSVPLGIFLKQRRSYYKIEEDNYSITLFDETNDIDFKIFFNAIDQELIVEKNGAFLIKFGLNGDGSVNSEDMFYKKMNRKIPKMPPGIKPRIFKDKL
jgi:hypothetical protein